VRYRIKVQLALLDNLVWVLLGVLFLFNAAFTPAFLSAKNMVNILYQSSVLGMLVLAQGIVMMVGELDLSIDAILAFAPGITILLTGTDSGTPAFASLSLTLLLGAAVGFYNGFFVAKLRANSFLFTLSSQIIMRGLVLFWVPFSLAGLGGAYTWLGRGRFGTIPVAVPFLLLTFLAFELLFRGTVFGRKFKLTGGNRQAAYIAGVNTSRTIILAFVLSGALASVAGLITAGRQNAVSNSMGSNLVTMAIAGTILGGCSFNGGVGKPVGMLGGALLLGTIDNSLTLLGVNVNLVSATKGALIFLAILLDGWREHAGAAILHRENLRKLKTESVTNM